MNGNYRAKPRTRPAAALLLMVWLIPPSVTADDGNLAEQLRTQQKTGRFQLMLEQVAERARQRAAAQPAATKQAGPSRRIDLGDWTESVRLQPVSMTEPVSLKGEVTATRRFRARQAYERDQQRSLHHRQQRRALIAAPRTRGAIVSDSFGTKRRELVRYNVENQRQALQRKLRR